MEWTEIFGSLLLILLTFFSITSFPISILGGLIGKLTNSFVLGLRISGPLVWLSICWTWKQIYSDFPSILLLGICFLVLGIHGYTKRKELNINAKMLIGGEQTGIVVSILLISFISENINWI